jgi:O-antigen/teichoic acid export membrane protein
MKEIRDIIFLLRSKISYSSSTEIIWVVTGQVLSIASGFILLKILSSLGKEDFGIYALIITITLLLGLIFYGPLQQGFIKFYYTYLDKNQAKFFVKIVFKILFTSSILFLVLVIIFQLLFSLFDFYQPAILYLVAGFFVITFKVNEFFNALLNLLRKRKENSLLQGAEKILTILALLLLLYLNSLNLSNAFLCMIIISALFATIKVSLFNKYVPAATLLNDPELSTVNKTIKKQLMVYTSPFIIWGISAWLQLNGEKWIINGYLSTADVGVYAIMMAIVNGLIMIPSNIIWEFSNPIIFQHFANPDKTENINTGKNYIKINVALVALITVVASVITYLFGKELIIILSNDSYTAFWFLLPFLCFGYGLFLIGQAQTTLGLALNLPGKYLVPKISTGIISVGLNFLLINNYGISGVAYTSVIVGIYYVFYITVVNKTIQNKITAALK